MCVGLNVLCVQLSSMPATVPFSAPPGHYAPPVSSPSHAQQQQQRPQQSVQQRSASVPAAVTSATTSHATSNLSSAAVPWWELLDDR
jgi:hypothetical protein